MWSYLEIESRNNLFKTRNYASSNSKRLETSLEKKESSSVAQMIVVKPRMYKLEFNLGLTWSLQYLWLGLLNKNSFQYILSGKFGECIEKTPHKDEGSDQGFIYL